MNMTNVIPPITHPLGAHLDQPSTDGIFIDDTHALMTEGLWDQLNEYSCSIPSGVYAGKIWKVIFRDDGEKALRWFSDSAKEGCCDINTRLALIV